MSELGLEPLAIQQRWELPAPQPGRAWHQLLCDYVAAVASACADQKTDSGRQVVIGHIKLLALFPDRGYLRVSAVSAGHPPTCTGLVPDGLDTLSVTLNVLVYGLPRGVLRMLSGEVAVALVAPRAGRVHVLAEEGPDVGHMSHHHHAA